MSDKPPPPTDPSELPYAPDPAQSPALPAPPERLEFKAVLLLGFMLALIVSAALYVMYARGLFETTQKLVLVAEDSEGVVVGMNLTFSGFPIGRVRRIELAEIGRAHVCNSSHLRASRMPSSA